MRKKGKKVSKVKQAAGEKTIKNYDVYMYSTYKHSLLPGVTQYPPRTCARAGVMIGRRQSVRGESARSFIVG